MNAASTGFAGEGHRPVDGCTGAVVEFGYDLFMVELVEDYAFPAAQGFIDYIWNDILGIGSMGERRKMKIEQQAGGHTSG